LRRNGVNLAGQVGAGMQQGPIFVTGTSRSGKSLLSRLLGLHPNIATHTREFRVWPRFYRKYGDLSQHENFERCLTEMLSYENIRTFIDNDTEYIRQKFLMGEPTYGRLFALFFEYHAERSGKSRWGDQSQKIERYADAIVSNYPTAKIVHMIRDLRDKCAGKSIRRQRGGKKNWREFQRDVSGWLRSVELAERNQKRYPDGYKIVRYETLVCQPRETLHDICAFLGETDIPPALLSEGLQGFRDDNGNSEFDTISSAYIGRFRETMSGREIAFIQARARQAMAAYNYELEPVRLSPRDYLLFYLFDGPIHLVSKYRRSVKPSRSNG
jgi:hypothetical protein